MYTGCHIPPLPKIGVSITFFQSLQDANYLDFYGLTNIDQTIADIEYPMNLCLFIFLLQSSKLVSIIHPFSLACELLWEINVLRMFDFYDIKGNQNCKTYFIF